MIEKYPSFFKFVGLKKKMMMMEKTNSKKGLCRLVDELLIKGSIPHKQKECLKKVKNTHCETRSKRHQNENLKDKNLIPKNLSLGKEVIGDFFKQSQDLGIFIKELCEMKSGPCIDLLTDLGIDRIRILIHQSKNEEIKKNAEEALNLKMKEFVKKILGEIEPQLKSTKTVSHFEKFFLKRVNDQFPFLEEKKKIFDIVKNNKTVTTEYLSSYLMEEIIKNYTKELFEKGLLFDYISMIPGTDVRSEVMDEIGQKKKFFASKNALRLFLLSIPNTCLAINSTEKFAKDPANFNSFQQRRQFVSKLIDHDQRIRLYRRMIREHPTETEALKKYIIESKIMYNMELQREGLRPKYKKL